MAYAAVGLAVGSCLATGCASSAHESSSTSAAQRNWSLVALGDSVPHGTNCDCSPYPLLSADLLTKSSGQPVAATNDSVAGFTSSDVLHQVGSDNAVIDHIRRANVIEIEIGANDVAYTKSCGTAVACYAPQIPTLEANLRTIADRVRELASGHKHLVVFLDYWSVWLGGQYAAAHGEAYVGAAETVTDQVNEAIKSVAATTGSAYVDLRAAFKGPNYNYDETHYLSSDGDHPNAAGHEQIATAAQAVIERALHL